MSAEEADDFTTTCGVAYHHYVFEVEVFEELSEIVGVLVHGVSFPWLRGAAVTAAVVGDAAVTLGGEEEHLVFEVIRVERPAWRQIRILLFTEVVKGRGRGRGTVPWEKVTTFPLGLPQSL